jgi:hypothetical protein
MAILKNTTIDDTGFLRYPIGTTAQRPSSPLAGMIRFNTTINNLEYYNGTTWVTAGAAPSIITSGLILHLDSSSVTSYPAKCFVGAKIYSVFSGGLRSSNYSVQYSDDNSSWTTAFSGVATNNSSCGLITNSGTGSPSVGRHRYWRYVEGSAVVGHHPRISRIVLVDDSGNDYAFRTYTSDNCSDSGDYIIGTVTQDVGGTTWFDIAGSNNGTLINGVGYSSTNSGSLTFNGSNQRVSTNFKPSGTRSYSIWIKYNTVNSLPNGYSLTGTQEANAYNYVGISNGGYFYYYFGANGEQINNTILSANTWYNQALTLDSSGIARAYLNGNLVSTLSSGIGATSTNEFSVGCINQNHWVNGSIPVVMQYNRALSGSEISQNFNALRSRYNI